MKIHGQPFDLSIFQVYAPTSANTEEEIEDFYSDLEDAYGKCGSQDIVIVMGDMNAKVGSEQDPLKGIYEIMDWVNVMNEATCGWSGAQPLNR